MSDAKNLDVLTPSSVNSIAQSSMLLDTTPPSTTRGEKMLIPQSVNSSKEDNTLAKANVTFETKVLNSSLEIGSKQSIETVVMPKLKDIHILASAEEETSPRLFSLSEHEQVSQGSKSKKASSEATVCNSLSLEKSLSHSKHVQVTLLYFLIFITSSIILLIKTNFPTIINQEY